MTDTERLDYVIGQVATLKAFCMCVSLVHENPAALLEGFEKFSEMTTAKTLPTPASEAMIDGIEEMKQVLLTVLQDAVERRASVHKP
jgi:hypothetical protein